MKKIVLISCVSKKKPYETKAENLYDSSLFHYALEYGKSLNPDQIFILSALHGLVSLNEVIGPYERTLNNMNAYERRTWSEKVVNQMRDNGLNLKNDHFIFLAGW